MKMSNKIYKEPYYNFKISNNANVDKKPFNTTKKRVDINILRSRLDKTESKELRKNILILTLLIICVGFLGIYFSL